MGPHELTRLGAEFVFGGSDCQDYSLGNRNRKGLEGHTGNNYLKMGSSMTHAYDGFGVAAGISENSPNVLKKETGKGGGKPLRADDGRVPKLQGGAARQRSRDQD